MMSERRWMRYGVVSLSALVVLTSATVASAQQGEDLDAFEVGKLQDQMELDITPVPVGMGALFIPSMTDPSLEPRVLVYSGGDRVATGSPGKRIVLPPGDYRVVFGSGDEATRAERTVRVTEGVTSPVDPFFGAVRITAVDRSGRPVATRYVISRSDGAITWKPARTSEEGSYSTTPTWILAPGRYNIALGGRADTDDDRFAVSIAPGEVLRYRLVVDDDELVRVEFAEREVLVEPSIWRLRWVIGGDFGLERTSSQLASFNGDALRLGAYTNTTLGLDTGNHLALTNIRLDESWLALESEVGQGLPLQKLTDEFSVEVLYNYRLGGIIGPYVRASGRTSFFDTYLYPGQDMDLTIQNSDGTPSSTRTAVAGDDFRLMQGFAPLFAQEGVGVGLTFVDNDYVSFIVRGGAAARQSYYRGGTFIQSATASTATLVILDDKQDLGGEATAVFGLRLGGVFSLESSFESFVPQGQIFSGDDFKPVYRFDNTVALSLGRFAALVYDVTLRRDDVQIEQMQIRQNLSLRLTHTLF